MTWIVASSLDELPAGEAIRLPTDPPVAVFHTDDGFYAIADTCTHAQSSLSEGDVDGDTVECALHGATFCLQTGAVLCPPAAEPVATFPVEVRDGKVWVDLS